jgi:hypothetical protein
VLLKNESINRTLLYIKELRNRLIVENLLTGVRVEVLADRPWEELSTENTNCMIYLSEL